MIAFGELVNQSPASNSKGLCYVDVGPFNTPLLCITSPTLAQQVSANNPALAFHRPPRIREWFRPLAGGDNLVDLPKHEWEP